LEDEEEFGFEARDPGGEVRVRWTGAHRTRGGIEESEKCNSTVREYSRAEEPRWRQTGRSGVMLSLKGELVGGKSVELSVEVDEVPAAPTPHNTSLCSHNSISTIPTTLSIPLNEMANLSKAGLSSKLLPAYFT